MYMVEAAEVAVISNEYNFSVHSNKKKFYSLPVSISPRRLQITHKALTLSFSLCLEKLDEMKDSVQFNSL
jgi:hypothetical protein